MEKLWGALDDLSGQEIPRIIPRVPIEGGIVQIFKNLRMVHDV